MPFKVGCLKLSVFLFKDEALRFNPKIKRLEIPTELSVSQQPSFGFSVLAK